MLAPKGEAPVEIQGRGYSRSGASLVSGRMTWRGLSAPCSLLPMWSMAKNAVVWLGAKMNKAFIG